MLERLRIKIGSTKWNTEVRDGDTGELLGNVKRIEIDIDADHHVMAPTTVRLTLISEVDIETEVGAIQRLRVLPDGRTETIGVVQVGGREEVISGTT